jgi:formiminotetrahydrofolate cyclodeaminase
MLSTSLADLPMAKIIELICSNSATPGAGAAGALTLALAAACAGKAASISLKHSDDAHLRVALDRFQELCRYALQEAEHQAQRGRRLDSGKVAGECGKDNPNDQ